MNINEALKLLNFRIGTLDDVSGRAINPIVNNRILLLELYEQMKKYAMITKGIEDVFSFPLNTNTPIIAAPTLALRSEAYFFAGIIQAGVVFPCDMKSPRDVFPIFRFNPISGLTNWIMPWNAGTTKYLNAYPMKSASAKTTTTNGALLPTDTTITVVSTTSFIKNNGRITIESEKILYGRLDATHFYDCVRGVEMTTAVSHITASTVSENNIFLYYSRLPMPITMTDDNFIDQSILSRAIEIFDEHLEGIFDATAYKILIKIDPERAAAYKKDYEDLYLQYASDIRKGSWRGRQGANIRSPYAANESSVPFGSNIMY